MGKPGYFAQELQVYGRKGEPCRVCGTPIVATKHAQRSDVLLPSLSEAKCRSARKETYFNYPLAPDVHCPAESGSHRPDGANFDQRR